MNSPSQSAPQITLTPVPCPLCDCTESSRLLVVPDWYCGLKGSEDFAIVRCNSCSHVYMNPAPTPDSIPACYPDGYAPHQSTAEGESIPSIPAAATAPAKEAKSPWYLSTFVRSIPGLRSLYYWLTDTRSQPVPSGPGQGRRSLEIGCGAGNYLVALRDAGWHPEGLDLVAAAVEVSRTRGFAVHHGLLESYPARDGTYDGVFAWMVMEHVPRPRETLAIMHRLLKPGGTLGISVPNYAGLERRVFGRYWSAMELPRHLQQFTPAILRKLLQETGFTDVEVIYQPTLADTIGSIGYWLRERFPNWSWGPKLVDWFFLNPPLIVTLVLGPFAHLLALLHLGGRITVFARRSENVNP